MKVLRFSKLLGFGRATSLPKVWKGTRKRKKTRPSESGGGQNDPSRTDSTSSNTDPTAKQPTLQTIPEEGHKLASSKSVDDSNNDDVFKLFEEGFGAKKSSDDQPPPVQTLAEAPPPAQPSVEAKLDELVKEEEDELEFESDDELDFLKPYYLNADKSNGNDNTSPNGTSNGPLSAHARSLNAKSTWINGPASYWYEYDDKYAVMASEKASAERSLKLKEKNRYILPRIIIKYLLCLKLIL